jgi:hypothetical protein
MQLPHNAAYVTMLLVYSTDRAFPDGTIIVEREPWEQKIMNCIR